MKPAVLGVVLCAVAPAVALAQSPVTTINGEPLSAQQAYVLRRFYGAVPPPGHYWYDARSGLYGLLGYEAAGYIRAGHSFAPMPPGASRGRTGVFVNGRQLNGVEKGYFESLVGPIQPGRYWLDGNSGYAGLEGDPRPLVNVAAAYQQQQRRTAANGGNGYRWRHNGTAAGAENGCVWMAIPGRDTYASPGCY